MHWCISFSSKKSCMNLAVCVEWIACESLTPHPHPSYLTLVFWSCNHFIHQKYIMNTNTFWNTSAFFFWGGGVLSNYTITIKENCVENLPSIPSIPAFSYCIRFAVFCVSFSFNINLMIFLYTLMIHVQC